MDPSFQRDYLRDFNRRNSGPVLALFGKHPAWNDHMDDLGLSTPSLRACKKMLYIEGMAANAARQQSTNGDVTSYRHLLLWFRGREAILLRLVESADGRGRGFFPLVGALHFEAVSMADALRLLIPALRGFVDACRALHSRDAVIDHHRHTGAHLRSELQRLPASTATEPATSLEIDAMREAPARSGRFTCVRIPVTRYDASQSFAAVAAGGSRYDAPLLLAQGDMDGFTTLCHGQPDKPDFWFLRGKGGE